MATTADKATFFIPDAGEWRKEIVDLSAFALNDHLILEFVNVGGYGQPIYLDNIKIETIIPTPYLNMDTGQRFATLSAAITVATAGDTILLTDNAEENTPVDIPSGINFIVQDPYTITFKNP